MSLRQTTTVSGATGFDVTVSDVTRRLDLELREEQGTLYVALHDYDGTVYAEQSLDHPAFAQRGDRAAYAVETDRTEDDA